MLSLFMFSFRFNFFVHSQQQSNCFQMLSIRQAANGSINAWFLVTILFLLPCFFFVERHQQCSISLFLVLLLHPHDEYHGARSVKRECEYGNNFNDYCCT